MRLSNIYKIMLDLKYVDPIETSRDIYYVHCSAEAIGQNLNYYAIKLKRRLGFPGMLHYYSSIQHLVLMQGYATIKSEG